MEAGAHAVETDVHLSRDGVVVLSHVSLHSFSQTLFLSHRLLWENEVPYHISDIEARTQDPNLKRCFGVDRKIVDCDWEYLAGLRSLRKPHVRMPRFVDLLEWLCEDGMEHVWVLLDIKVTRSTLQHNNVWLLIQKV